MLIAAGALFGWSKALYSIIYQFCSTQVIQLLYKRYKKETLFIISDKSNEIYHAINDLTHHDATLFKGVGCYEEKEKTLIYSVINSEAKRELIPMIRGIDEHAFINVVKTEELTVDSMIFRTTDERLIISCKHVGSLALIISSVISRIHQILEVLGLSCHTLWYRQPLFSSTALYTENNSDFISSFSRRFLTRLSLLTEISRSIFYQALTVLTISCYIHTPPDIGHIQAISDQ